MVTEVVGGAGRRGRLEGLLLGTIGVVAGSLVLNMVAYSCPIDEFQVDCCTVNPNARGCTNVACCDAVCACDPYCCQIGGNWDSYCVREAQQICGLNCGVSPCADTPCAGDCCSTHWDSKGCDDVTCCEAVCAVNPACCNLEWGWYCDVQAGILCAGCPNPCPGQGDCCTAHGSIGCNDTACCEEVCLVGPGCCGAGGTVVWDSSCADYARQVCDECCMYDSECDDEDACTIDDCFDGRCQNTPRNCNDGNVCTDDYCDPETGCEYFNNSNDCNDGDWCTVNDQCSGGTCSGTPRDCDDGNPCTDDSCSGGACTHADNGLCGACCDGVTGLCEDDLLHEDCMGPQFTWYVGSRCSQIVCGACVSERNLSDPRPSYCPGTPKEISIAVDAPLGSVALGVEDSPPSGWLVTNISDAGTWDLAAGKVKWGPFFAPFPSELIYHATPPLGESGLTCFEGVISIDGLDRPICGDECIELHCCPHMEADGLRPACEGCGDCNCATCQDGQVELCEMIGYACAWQSGCNDDLAGVTRAAYIWKNGECYCFDDLQAQWFPVLCPGPLSHCCPEALGAVATAPVPTPSRAVAVARLPFSSPEQSARPGGTRGRGRLLSGAKGLTVPITVTAPRESSALALEYSVPEGWAVSDISDGGQWDGIHRKVKWGPFLDHLSRTVRFTVHPLTAKSPLRGFIGTVSVDGINQPVIEE